MGDYTLFYDYWNFPTWNHLSTYLLSSNTNTKLALDTWRNMLQIIRHILEPILVDVELSESEEWKFWQRKTDGMWIWYLGSGKGVEIFRSL